MEGNMLKGFASKQLSKAFVTMLLFTTVLTSLLVLGISTDAWSESALIHNSNRFGTCSNAAFSGTSQTICETNGGTWTPSTKWTGSWGVPAGQYGEFVCETCHEWGSDNIKNVISRVTAPSGTFPGSTINFLSTTAPNGFGDDTGGHTTSDKVCEVCHSTTLYHRYDTTAQTIFDHNNNSDCVVCHTHSKGFKPEECDSCHGYPPIANLPNASSPGGNTGLADNPYATGSLYAGAHDKHVNNLGYANCAICHNGYSMPSDAGTYTIDISFSFNGSTTGSYDGQTTARYNAPNTATGNMTCSTVYCHSNVQGNTGSGVPTAYATPQWDGTVACGGCHKGDAEPKIDTGSHTRHVSTMTSAFGLTEYNMACSKCHNGSGSGSAQHVNHEINLAFEINPVEGTDTALYSQAPNLPGDGYGTCSNVYCHSRGQTNGGGPITLNTADYKTPVWGGPGGCTGWCHANPPVNGNHMQHDQGTNSNIYCMSCHYPSRMWGDNRGFNHADGVVDVFVGNVLSYVNWNVDYGTGLYNGSDTFPGDHGVGKGYGTCSSLYCHSNAKAGTAVEQFASPKWGGSPLGCDGCHAYPPDYASGGAGSPTANSHVQHVTDNGITCEKCHFGTTEDGTTVKPGGAWGVEQAMHVNKEIDIVFSLVNPSAIYEPGTKTCSTTYCHGSGTPQWGGGTAVCGTCHAANNTLAGSHAKHYQTATSASDRNAANNSTSTAYRFNCGVCHFSTPHASGPENANRTAQVAFDGTIGSGTYLEGGVSQNDPATNFMYTNATCSASYCHGNYPGSGKNATPIWGTAASGACGTCHGGSNDANYPQSGSHFVHVGSGEHNYACTMCHKGIVGGAGPTSYTISDKAKHVNSTMDWSFDASDIRLKGGSEAYSIASGTVTPSDGTSRAYGTCNNLYCHSIVQTATGGVLTPNSADYKTPTWGGTSACNSCHDTGPGIHAAPAGASYISTGSHSRHLTYLFTIITTMVPGDWIDRCAVCHSTGDGVLGPEHCVKCHNAYPDPSHANGVINIRFANLFGGVTATYNDPTGAPANGFAGCSNTYCHSAGTGGTSHVGDIRGIAANTTTNWGTGALACDSCHSGGSTTGPDYANGTPKANSHNKHVVGSGYMCVDCHNLTVDASNVITTESGLYFHVNAAYNVKGANITTYTYAADGGTCTTVCHGSGMPKWGDNTANTTCEKCHGSAATVPFRDTAGNTVNTGAKVGAHAAHLNATHGYSNAVACSECHVVPGSVNAAGHIDTAIPAELTFQGPIGIAGSLTPVYGAGSCSTTWCHGAGLSEGGSVPVWNTPLLTGVAANDCTKCHGYPPAGIGAHAGKLPTDCHTCHSNVNAAGDGFTPGGKALHVDGTIQVTADSCSDCHSSAGGATSGSTPDAYHAKHIQTAFVGSLSGGDYGSTAAGWYAYSNTGGVPDMGCGYCHPQSAANHMNGSIDLNMSNNDGGAAGTLKAKNAATPNFSQNSRVSVTCSSVYCHSNGYDGGSGYTYQTTPNWYGGTFAADKCASCHGNSPNSSIAGSISHYSQFTRSDGATKFKGHFVGIHYDNIYTGTTGLAPAGNTGTSSHGNAATSSTINCQTCHNDTVASSANDKNTVCVTCHTGGAAKGDAAIKAGSTTHIDGKADVAFDPISVKSKAQLRDASQSLIQSIWSRIVSGVAYKNSGAYDGAVSPLNTGAQYDGGTKSCTVSCHNNNSVTWGAPSVSCGSCHTGL